MYVGAESPPPGAERSRLLDEAPCDFRSTPTSPQHCALVQFGIAGLGAVDLYQSDGAEIGRHNWFSVAFEYFSSALPGSSSRLFCDIFAGETACHSRRFRHSSALWGKRRFPALLKCLQLKCVSKLKLNDRSFWFHRLFSSPSCRSGSLTACLNRRCCAQCLISAQPTLLLKVIFVSP